MKHYPAPWNFRKYVGYTAVTITARGPHAYADDIPVAEVFDPRNAALVMAAPTLLTLLEEAVRTAMPLPAPLGPPMTEHKDLWPEWVGQARELIDLLEGEQP